MQIHLKIRFKIFIFAISICDVMKTTHFSVFRHASHATDQFMHQPQHPKEPSPAPKYNNSTPAGKVSECQELNLRLIINKEVFGDG